MFNRILWRLRDFVSNKTGGMPPYPRPKKEGEVSFEMWIFLIVSLCFVVAVILVNLIPFIHRSIL